MDQTLLHSYREDFLFSIEGMTNENEVFSTMQCASVDLVPALILVPVYVLEPTE